MQKSWLNFEIKRCSLLPLYLQVDGTFMSDDFENVCDGHKGQRETFVEGEARRGAMQI